MKRERTRYVCDLTDFDTLDFGGRMEGLVHETSAFSKKQGLSQVLSRHGCLFMYRELEPHADSIMTEREEYYARKRRIIEERQAEMSLYGRDQMALF